MRRGSHVLYLEVFLRVTGCRRTIRSRLRRQESIIIFRYRARFPLLVSRIVSIVYHFLVGQWCLEATGRSPLRDLGSCRDLFLQRFRHLNNGTGRRFVGRKQRHLRLESRTRYTVRLRRRRKRRSDRWQDDIGKRKQRRRGLRFAEYRLRIRSCHGRSIHRRWFQHPGVDVRPVMQEPRIVPLLQFVGGNMRGDRRRPGTGYGDPPEDIEDFATESVHLQVDWWGVAGQLRWGSRRWKWSFHRLITLRYPEPRVVTADSTRVTNSRCWLLLLGWR